VIYHGAQVIFRTTNGGQSWDVISPDLTRNDKSKQKWAGGPITGDNTGVETYDTVFAIAESPMQKGLIWVGTDDGLVQLTKDGGQTWTNVTSAMPGMPEWGTVSMIEPSPFDPSIAYVVVDAHRLDNMRPYLYKTTDYGQTWKRIDAKLPQDIYLHAVREDPKKKGQLYLGTERGVMFSTDAGETWRDLRLDLPTVAVHDLVVKGDDLVVGTHGRSLWILDNLRPIRDFDAAIASANVHLFPAADPIRWRLSGDAYGAKAADFSNPPRGASIAYYLKDKPKGELKIEILDAQGTVVRTLSSIPREPDGSEDNQDLEELKKAALSVEPGVHYTAWDLAWQGAAKIKNAKIDTGDPIEGPRAIPGPYTVRLNVDGKTQTVPLQILPDPRGDASHTDLEAQLAHALRVRDDVSKLTGLVNDLRSVKEQLKARAKALEPRKSEAGVSELLQESDTVVKKADALEDKLHNPTAEVVYDILAMKGGTRLYSRLAPLRMWAIDAEGAPTKGMLEVLQAEEKELSDLDRETKNFIEEEVGTLNATAVKLGLSFVIVK